MVIKTPLACRDNYPAKSLTNKELFIFSKSLFFKDLEEWRGDFGKVLILNG